MSSTSTSSQMKRRRKGKASSPSSSFESEAEHDPVDVDVDVAGADADGGLSPTSARKSKASSSPLPPKAQKEKAVRVQQHSTQTSATSKQQHTHGSNFGRVLVILAFICLCVAGGYFFTSSYSISIVRKTTSSATSTDSTLPSSDTSSPITSSSSGSTSQATVPPKGKGDAKADTLLETQSRQQASTHPKEQKQADETNKAKTSNTVSPSKSTASKPSTPTENETKKNEKVDKEAPSKQVDNSTHSTQSTTTTEKKKQSNLQDKEEEEDEIPLLYRLPPSVVCPPSIEKALTTLSSLISSYRYVMDPLQDGEEMRRIQSASKEPFDLLEKYIENLDESESERACSWIQVPTNLTWTQEVTASTAYCLSKIQTLLPISILAHKSQRSFAVKDLLAKSLRQNTEEEEQQLLNDRDLDLKKMMTLSREDINTHIQGFGLYFVDKLLMRPTNFFHPTAKLGNYLQGRSALDITIESGLVQLTKVLMQRASLMHCQQIMKAQTQNKTEASSFNVLKAAVSNSDSEMIALLLAAPMGALWTEEDVLAAIDTAQFAGYGDISALLASVLPASQQQNTSQTEDEQNAKLLNMTSDTSTPPQDDNQKARRPIITSSDGNTIQDDAIYLDAPEDDDAADAIELEHLSLESNNAQSDSKKRNITGVDRDDVAADDDDDDLMDESDTEVLKHALVNQTVVAQHAIALDADRSSETTDVRGVSDVLARKVDGWESGKDYSEGEEVFSLDAKKNASQRTDNSSDQINKPSARNATQQNKRSIDYDDDDDDYSWDEEDEKAEQEYLRKREERRKQRLIEENVARIKEAEDRKNRNTTNSSDVKVPDQPVQKRSKFDDDHDDEDLDDHLRASSPDADVYDDDEDEDDYISLQSLKRMADAGWNVIEPDVSLGPGFFTLTQHFSQGCPFLTLDLSKDNITSQYLAHLLLSKVPLIIKGGMNDWPAYQNFSKLGVWDDLQDEDLVAGKIPYSSVFGEREGMVTGAEFLRYLDDIATNQTEGNFSATAIPWYVFDYQVANRLGWFPGASGAEPGKAPLYRIPAVIEEALLGSNKGNISIQHQFIWGPAGSGAPVHYHCPAVNGLVYGRKRWFLFPPYTELYTKTHPRIWIQQVVSNPSFRERIPAPYVCTQEAGDLLYVPTGWSHGTINEWESIGVAVEYDVGNC